MKKAFNLENFSLAAIFLLPLYLWKIRCGFLATNFWEIMALASIVLWLAKKSSREFLKSLFRENRFFAIFIFLIFLGTALAFLAAEEKLKALGAAKSWIFLPIIFSLAIANILGREKIQRAFFALFFSSAAVAVVALVYLILGKLTYDFRLNAFFESPNQLAMCLAPGFLTGFFWLKEKRKNFKTGWLIIPLGIIAISLYATFSYAAWAAVFFSLLISLFWNGGKNRKWLWAALAIPVVFFLWQIGPEKTGSWPGAEKVSSLESRVAIWKSSGKIIADHWFFGIGPANFQAKYLEYQKYFPPYPEWAVPHPHNLFLAFWLQTGLIGLVGFGGILVLWAKSFLTDKSEEKFFAATIGSAVIIYFLIHGIVDTTYFRNDLAVVFWLSFFAAAFLSKQKPPSSGAVDS